MNTDSHPTDSRRIQLLRLLGKGGFGAVYLADVRSADGLVHRMAVKILHEEFSMEGEIGARARDEARLMSQLNHDNVVQVFGLTQVGKRSAVLMEFVEGIDCSTLIQHATTLGQGVPLRVAARIVECAADALHAAYTTISPQTGRPLCVVHRDIKPGNILVSLNGAVKVMDFGVARADFEREAVTKSHQFGTQRYMAPERWLEGEAVAKSDVFSLGLSFWELVTGEKFAQMPLAPRKYEENLTQAVAVFRLHAQATSRVEAASAGLVRGMLAYRVDKRFSAQEVSEILAEISELQPGPSLRRYARRWIPGLLLEKAAELAADPGFEDLSASHSVGQSAERSAATLSVPVNKIVSAKQAVPANRDPRAAPTVFEPVEPQPEPVEPQPENKIQPIDAAPKASFQSAASKKRNVFLFSFGVSVFLGAAWILNGELSEPQPGALPEVVPGKAIVNTPAKTPGEGPSQDVDPAEGDTPDTLQVQALGQPDPPKPLLLIPEPPISAVPPADVERVTFKVLADPREGMVQVGDQHVLVSEMLSLPAGVHQFQYEGDGWTAACEVSIDSSVKKIKFMKGSGACVLLR